MLVYQRVIVFKLSVPWSCIHLIINQLSRFYGNHLIPSPVHTKHPLGNHGLVGNFHIIGTIYGVFHIRGMGLEKKVHVELLREGSNQSNP